MGIVLFSASGGYPRLSVRRALRRVLRSAVGVVVCASCNSAWHFFNATMGALRMSTPYQLWAARHPQAAADLFANVLHALHEPAPAGTPTAESYVQDALRLESARCGVMLWRNNVGALQTPAGAWVRFGLANDSPALNKRLKSADLIGVRRVLIGPQHIGHTIGQFVSREAKHATWRPGEDPARETAQFAWAALVNSWGGDARIVTGPGSF